MGKQPRDLCDWHPYPMVKLLPVPAEAESSRDPASFPAAARSWRRRPHCRQKEKQDVLISLRIHVTGIKPNDLLDRWDQP